MAKDRQDGAPSNSSVITSEGVRNSAQDYADRTANSSGHPGVGRAAQGYADRAQSDHVDTTYKNQVDGGDNGGSDNSGPW